MSALQPGIRGRAAITVAYEDTAVYLGSGGLPVYATPAMVMLMEKAALESVMPYLDEGEGTVGTRLEISHLAATPMGATVVAESELIAVDRRQLTFRVTARAGQELIGEGTHQRFVIQNERFMEKVRGKSV